MWWVLAELEYLLAGQAYPLQVLEYPLVDGSGVEVGMGVSVGRTGVSVGVGTRVGVLVGNTRILSTSAPSPAPPVGTDIRSHW